MAEMKISNTLVNDDSSQIIAYAEQVVDRLKNYPHINLNSPTVTQAIQALDDLKHDFDILIDDPEKVDDVLNTFKEIERFLKDIETKRAYFAKVNNTVYNGVTYAKDDFICFSEIYDPSKLTAGSTYIGDYASLNQIISALSFGVISLDIDATTGTVTATAPNSSVGLSDTSKIDPITGKVNIAIEIN